MTIAAWRLRGQPDSHCRSKPPPGDYSGLETAGPTGLVAEPGDDDLATIAAWRLRGQPDSRSCGVSCVSDYSGLETAGPTGLMNAARQRRARL